MTLCFSGPLVFAAYKPIATHRGETLDQARLFTCLTLISLLAAPMVHLFQALPALTSALACFGRIQGFLQSNERYDYRESSMAPLVSTQQRLPPSQSILTSQSLGSPSEDETLRKRGVNGTAIVLKNASFGLDAKSSKILKNVSCEIRKGDVVMIVGETASGKSTMLRALLGETMQLEGIVEISSNKIGYCAQLPWLTNESIRDIIIGSCEFEEAWFKTVVHACVLDEELAEVTYDFETTVGSKGDKLSGGQKQRLVTSSWLPNQHSGAC